MSDVVAIAVILALVALNGWQAWLHSRGEQSLLHDVVAELRALRRAAEGPTP